MRSTHAWLVLTAALAGCTPAPDRPAGDAVGGDGVPGDAAADTTEKARAPLPDDWRIAVAGDSGRVGPTTGRDELGRMFSGRVSDTVIHMGEGHFEPGAVVHPDDPRRRIEVVWLDSTRARPRRVQVAGDSSRWFVGPGITLGSSLAELERLNGRAFSLTGFGWDYGGTVMGWDQGALEQALLGGNGRVILRLAVDSGSAASRDARAVGGDGVFRSDNPAMQRLEPEVRRIIVEYDTEPRP